MENAIGISTSRFSVASATLVAIAVAIALVPDSRMGSVVDSLPAWAVPSAIATCVVIGIVLGHLARRTANRSGAEEDDVATVALVCHYLMLIVGIGAYLEGPMRDALSGVLNGVVG